MLTRSLCAGLRNRDVERLENTGCGGNEPDKFGTEMVGELS